MWIWIESIHQLVRMETPRSQLTIKAECFGRPAGSVMLNRLLFVSVCLLAASVHSAVNVSVQDSNGAAAIIYECTAGEVVRSFALDVSVDRGQIVGISNFFRGVSTSAAQGYGIFPAAFRDHITVSSGTNANWDTIGYTPLAVVADRPGDTLPGLGSNGVTLEFGGLWDPAAPAAIPPATGALCVLLISEPAHVSVAANVSRGGVLSSSTDVAITPVFTGAMVGPSVVITGVGVSDGVVTITFEGGELETAPTVAGPWTGTGNSSGTYADPVADAPLKFYRVNHH
jgi:hypothetical protein